MHLIYMLPVFLKRPRLRLLLVWLVIQLFSPPLFSQPAWTYTNTGVNHVILLPQGIPLAVWDEPLTTGDYIGVFFEDNGQFHCAGYIMYEGVSTGLTAWGNDPLTPAKDGFLPGEEFRFAVWRAADGATCPATVVVDGASPSGSTYTQDGMTILSQLAAMPPPNLGPDWEGCEGEALTLEAGPYPIVQWSTGSTATQINPTESGSYSLTVTTPLGPLTDQVQLTFHPLPNATIHLVQTGPLAAILSTQPGYASYLWSTGQTTDTIHIYQNGSYAVSITSSQGCISQSQTTVTTLAFHPANWSDQPIISQDADRVVLQFFAPVRGRLSLTSLSGRLLQEENFEAEQTWELRVPPTEPVFILGWRTNQGTGGAVLGRP